MKMMKFWYGKYTKLTSNKKSIIYKANNFVKKQTAKVISVQFIMSME